MSSQISSIKNPQAHTVLGHFKGCQYIRRFMVWFGKSPWGCNIVAHVSAKPENQRESAYQEPKNLRKWMIAFKKHDDQDAFQQIFEYYREKLWSKLHLRRFYGYEPEDLFQEVNRDVARFLKKEIPKSLMGLVYRIADRKMVDFLRKEPRYKHAAMDVPFEEVDGSFALERLDQEAWASVYDLQRFLFSKWVNIKQREVLVLHFLLGHTLTEIHRQTGIPLNTVKSRLREGLRKLRVFTRKAESSWKS